MTGLWSGLNICAGTVVVFSLGQERDGLEPVVRARTGPGSVPGFREVTGPDLSQVSGQRLGWDWAWVSVGIGSGTEP